MKDQTSIGIDIGATTIKSAIVKFNLDNFRYSISSQKVVDTNALKGPNAVIKQIFIVIDELLDKNIYSNILGIGIGAPGIVIPDGGVVKDPPNFSDWNEVELGAIVQKHYNLNTVVENDANAAAIAEAKFGSGINYNNFLFVIWGTGVGGGIILDGKIYRGPSGGAGEIGHITIDYNGALCNCGNRGCIESFIGQRYLSNRTREKLKNLMKDKKPSKILELVSSLDDINPSIIALAAMQGDMFAKEMLTESGNLLGVAITSVFNVLDLKVAIIGGGISAAGEFVFDAIKKSVQSRVLKSKKNEVIIIPAKLGNTAGIIGAASLVI